MSEGKETVLVTGTSGRIGYPVAKRLAESFNVVGFDRKAPSHPPPSAECLYVDLTIEESVRRGLQAIRNLHGDRIASVIHLAAYYDFSGVPSPLYDKVTVKGTQRLLRMLQDFKVEQFIFSSTTLVHAPSARGIRIHEGSPFEDPPKWPYPKSKIETEKVIHDDRGNIPAVILRVAGVYDDFCHSIPLALQMQRIYERDPAAYFSPGDPSAGRQPFVHNADVGDAILLAVARRKELPPEVTLLIGEPNALSYDDLQRALGRLIHGVEWKTKAIPPLVAKVGVRLQNFLPLGRSASIYPWMLDIANYNIELDITNARTVLGWNPHHSLQDTLPKMVSELKADPFTWYQENGLKPPLWLRELMPVAVANHAKEMESHELMQLGKQIKHEISALSSNAPSGPPKHDVTGMDKEATSHNGSMDKDMDTGMDMDRGGSDGRKDVINDKESQLEHMRSLQAKLRNAWEREVAAQREEDTKAQKLMESDPGSHIKMMKMEQEHRQLALELPRMLLERESEVYKELQQARKEEAAKGPDTGKMMGQMIPMERWSQIPLLALGLWLIISPFTAGYTDMLLTWSDIISGIMVITLAIVVLRTRRSWAAWANALVGIWLALAPVLFWAPDAATYMNDTLVGVFVIVFSVLVPMKGKMLGPEVPLGWSYNPSSWIQRAPILALALLSFLMTQYMAAYQLGHINWAWDPIFGSGTVVILDSSVSKAFPISDAGAGAFIYLIELLSGFMGDPRRWRTMPWMVALFGLLVVPLGIVSIVLVIMQPVVVGAWCTICLITALLMLIMIALSLDEVLAMTGYLQQTRRAGKSVWRTFWRGGDALGDDLTPRRYEKNRAHEMFWGVTLPWNLIVVAALGVWLMAAPAVFQLQGMAANIDYVLGPLVIVVTITALAEVARAARFLNIILAIVLIVMPWLLGDAMTMSALNSMVVGVLIVVLSIPAGKIKNTYGSWNRFMI